MGKIINKSRKIFIEEYESKLKDVLISLLNYKLKLDRESKKEIKRFFHSIKGTASTLNFTTLSLMSAEYEDYIDSLEDVSMNSHEIFSEILQGLSIIKKELDNMYEGLEEYTFNEEASCLLGGISDEYTTMASSGNILVLDDDIAILNLFDSAFSMTGYNVIVTPNPYDAIDIILGGGIDLVILDIIMPELSGFDVLEILNKNDVDIPVIVLSGKTLIDDKVNALNKGADDYITKPFNMEEVIARVERALKRSSKYKLNLNKDNLTGAYTKRFFMEKVSDYKKDMEAKDKMFSIAFIDLDRFKEVNDQYGHIIGDYILKEFTLRLKNSLDSNDFIFRFGGDEFLVLFSDLDEDGAYKIVENFRRNLENSVFRYDELNDDIYITISAGVTSISKNDNTEKALDKADKALYRAKALGRNTIVCYSQLREKDKVEGKILLIDDENAILHLLKSRLKYMGYEVYCATNQETGIAKAKEIKPDLLIIDISPTKLNGFRVCKEIKESSDTKDAKIIVLSSKNSESDIIRLIKMGVNDYINKPFSISELEMRIKKLLVSR